MKNPDLHRKLSGGDRRSIGKSEEVVADVLMDGRLFAPLIDCLLADDPLVRMRAADAVEKITILRPDFLLPYKAVILNRVAKTDQQEVRWHVAQLVSRLDLSKTERKQVAALMDEYLADKSSIVRTCAMQALADLAQKDAGLRPNIIKQLKTLTETGTPAMQSRGKKLLSELGER